MRQDRFRIPIGRRFSRMCQRKSWHRRCRLVARSRRAGEPVQHLSRHRPRPRQLSRYRQFSRHRQYSRHRQGPRHRNRLQPLRSPCFPCSLRRQHRRYRRYSRSPRSQFSKSQFARNRSARNRYSLSRFNLSRFSLRRFILLQPGKFRRQLFHHRPSRQRQSNRRHFTATFLAPKLPTQNLTPHGRQGYWQAG